MTAPEKFFRPRVPGWHCESRDNGRPNSTVGSDAALRDCRDSTPDAFSESARALAALKMVTLLPKIAEHLAEARRFRQPRFDC